MVTCSDHNPQAASSPSRDKSSAALIAARYAHEPPRTRTISTRLLSVRHPFAHSRSLRVSAVHTMTYALDDPPLHALRTRRLTDEAAEA